MAIPTVLAQTAIPGCPEKETWGSSRAMEKTSLSRRKLLNLPRRAAWLAGAALALAILVIAVVTLFHSQAPASPVPQPLPDISGPLGQHLEQLKKRITP